MRQLHKFLRLTNPERQLLISATLLLEIIRLGLWLLPFQTLQHLLAKITHTPSKKNTEPLGVDKVVWAVAAASEYIPGEVKCLARALATQVLLGRLGLQVQLRIGVAKSSIGQLEAHAWVESQGRVVIGGLKDLKRYIPLPNIEVQRL